MTGVFEGVVTREGEGKVTPNTEGKSEREQPTGPPVFPLWKMEKGHMLGQEDKEFGRIINKGWGLKSRLRLSALRSYRQTEEGKV